MRTDAQRNSANAGDSRFEPEGILIGGNLIVTPAPQDLEKWIEVLRIQLKPGERSQLRR